MCANTTALKAQIPEEEDTVRYILLPEVEIFSRHLSAEERKAYLRLVYNVKRAYPYARMAGERFMMYEDSLAYIKKRRDRKQFVKRAEAEIREDFLEDLKSMTTSQGKILFKLISRQTGSSSYEIIKELKSGITAFGYQILGSMFGYNLKREYDPKGEDFAIEHIVKLIEKGEMLEIAPKQKPALDPTKEKAKGKKNSRQRSVYNKPLK